MMKRSPFAKKFRFLFPILVLLCCAIVLSACQKGTETSLDSSSTVSEEAVVPPTETEQFTAAMQSFGTYFTDIDKITGMNLFAEPLTVIESGSIEQKITLETLSTMGESMIGDSPMEFLVRTDMVDSAAVQDCTLLVLGDEVKFRVFSDDSKELISFPDISGTVFTTYSETDGETAPTLTADMFDSLTESIGDAFVGVINDDVIEATETENVTVFSMTFTEEMQDAVTDALEKAWRENGLWELLGMDELLDSEDAEVTEEEEPVTETSVVLTVSDGKATSLRISEIEDGEVLAEIVYEVSVSGQATVIGLSFISDGVNMIDLECTLTASEDSLRIDAAVTIDTVELELELTCEQEDDGKTVYTGTLTASVNYEGVIISVPLSLAGSNLQTETGYETAFALSASANGMVEISMAYTETFTSDVSDITVTIPEQETYEQFVFEGEFAEQFAEVYPNAYILYQSILGMEQGSDGYSTADTYVNEDGTVYVSIYDDGTVNIMASATYTDDGSAMLFYLNDELLFAAPYTQEGGTYYELFGEPYEMLYDETALNLYKFGEDFTTWVDLYFYDESTATVDFCLPYDTDSGAFTVHLPDGSTLPVNVSFSEDLLTLTLCGVELHYFSYE